MMSKRRQGRNQFAHRLRESATLAERRLWSRISGNQLGATFVRQARIGAHYATFAARSKKLGIEIDNGNGAGKHRITECISTDFRVLVFWEMDVLSRTDDVVAAITEALQSSRLKKSGSSSEPQWPELE